MIEMSLQQSEPVALPHRSPGRQGRSVAAYALLTALMIVVGLPVFVPAVVLYCGIRFGTRAAAAALFAAAVLATGVVPFSGYPPDVMRFAYSLVTGTLLTLGVPALLAIPFVKRGDSFGRVLMVLLIGSALGMMVNELLWRVVAGYSPYAAHVAQAREATAFLLKAYKTGGMPSDALRMAERSTTYYTRTLIVGVMLINVAVNFVLSLLMVGRLPAGRALGATEGAGTGTYQLRNLSLPDGVLFLFIVGGLAPLATGLAHTLAANALMVAAFLYMLQGFALLRFLLASNGVGFIGALLAFSLTFLSGVGPLLLGLAGLFDPFFDFRHFKKRKDDSHESHSD
jgi:uncharacterized protein YybS (DUF2232 family)